MGHSTWLLYWTWVIFTSERAKSKSWPLWWDWNTNKPSVLQHYSTTSVYDPPLTLTHFKSWMSIINVWILWHSTHFRIPISTCFCFIFQKKKSNKQTFCNYVLIQSSLAQFQLFVRTLNVNIHKQAAVCLKISQLIKVTADSLSPQILMRRLNVPCRELLKRTSSALVLCGTISFSVMST